MKGGREGSWFGGLWKEKEKEKVIDLVANGRRRRRFLASNHASSCYTNLPSQHHLNNVGIIGRCMHSLHMQHQHGTTSHIFASPNDPATT
jgi:hypothetical protein